MVHLPEIEPKSLRPGWHGGSSSLPTSFARPLCPQPPLLLEHFSILSLSCEQHHRIGYATVPQRPRLCSQAPCRGDKAKGLLEQGCRSGQLDADSWGYCEHGMAMHDPPHKPSPRRVCLPYAWVWHFKRKVSTRCGEADGCVRVGQRRCQRGGGRGHPTPARNPCRFGRWLVVSGRGAILHISEEKQRKKSHNSPPTFVAWRLAVN